jgi:N-acetyl-anhydromuramyl-L-alanine amidase AmpD
MCETCSEVQAAPTPTLSRRAVLLGGLALGAALVGCNTAPTIITPTPRLEPLVVTAPSIGDCATWGARAASSPVVLTGAKPDKIIVHHTDTPNSSDTSQTHAFQLARQIQNYHMDSNGWIDSGQHFTISRGGFITEARHRSLETLRGRTNLVSGAHCPGQNNLAVGIENEGNYTSTVPPQALYNQLVSLCAYICTQYGIASDRIYGHRDYINTDCPGDQLYALLPQLRRDVAARLGSAPSRTWPTVKKGDNAERVKSLQYLLRSQSYSLSADGAFGSGTETTVKSFQTLKALPADGIVGRDTWEDLIVTVRNPSSGDAVRAAQSQLAARGYAVSVDGAFGAGTQTAVTQFQTAQGLSSDGIVGADTWAKLVG